MTSYAPNTLPADIAAGNIDFSAGADTFKCMLITTSYTPNQAHGRRSDYTAFEVSGTGYTAGGVVITSAISSANNITSIQFSNPSWASAGPGWSARRAVIYKSRGGAASADEVIAVIDFGADQPSNGTTFVVQFSNNLTVSTPIAA